MGPCACWNVFQPGPKEAHPPPASAGVVQATRAPFRKERPFLKEAGRDPTRAIGRDAEGRRSKGPKPAPKDVRVQRRCQRVQGVTAERRAAPDAWGGQRTLFVRPHRATGETEMAKAVRVQQGQPHGSGQVTAHTWRFRGAVKGAAQDAPPFL